MVLLLDCGWIKCLGWHFLQLCPVDVPKISNLSVVKWLIGTTMAAVYNNRTKTNGHGGRARLKF